MREGNGVQMQQHATYDEARAAAKPGDAMSTLLDWLAAYPMNNHAELGRSGAVCPFVKQASRLKTLRVGICPAGPDEEDRVFDLMRGTFSEIEAMPAPPGKERLRTILVGFPNCAGPDGVSMLDRIYHRHKYYTLFRFRMMAFFHADSQIGGLWNHDFKPMRAPMPMLGARYLIEQDAVFAAKHRIMLAPYLLRFGVAGARRLGAYYTKSVRPIAPTEV